MGPDKVRNGPLALRYPLSVTSVTEIRLHRDWTLDIEPASVEDPAFRYRFANSTAGSVVTTTEHLDMLADHVQPADVAGYAAHVRKMRDSLGLRLFMPDAVPAAQASGGMNWPIALLALFMAGGAAWLVRRAWQWDPAPRPAAAGAPQGLGGWLILPMIAVVASPIRMLASIATNLPAYSAGTWASLTVSGSAHYSALWAPVLLGELAAGILLFAFSLLVAWLFFSRRSSLPRAYVIFLAVALVERALDLGITVTMPVKAGTVTPSDWITLMRDLVSASIWSSYFLTSQRVAATFVERLHRPTAVSPTTTPVDAGDAVPSVL